MNAYESQELCVWKLERGSLLGTRLLSRMLGAYGAGIVFVVESTVCARYPVQSTRTRAALGESCKVTGHRSLAIAAELVVEYAGASLLGMSKIGVPTEVAEAGRGYRADEG